MVRVVNLLQATVAYTRSGGVLGIRRRSWVWPRMYLSFHADGDYIFEERLIGCPVPYAARLVSRKYRYEAGDTVATDWELVFKKKKRTK